MKTLSKVEVGFVSGAGFAPIGGPFFSAGTTLGGFYGPVGSLIGGGIGYFIDTRDHDAAGERFKKDIASEIAKGNLFDIMD